MGLSVPAASHHFRWCDMVCNIMGAFFIGWGTDCRQYTNLTLSIVELVIVSSSSPIHLREHGGSCTTKTIIYVYANWNTRRARILPQIQFQPHPFSTAVSSRHSIIMNCSKRINDGLACSVSCGGLLLVGCGTNWIPRHQFQPHTLTYQSYSCEF